MRKIPLAQIRSITVSLSGKAIKIAFFHFQKSQSRSFYILRKQIRHLFRRYGIWIGDWKLPTISNSLPETNMFDSFTIFVFRLGGEEWKLVAEKLGLTLDFIRFLDKRTLNPAEEILAYIADKYRHVTAGDLYDLLTACELPLVADFL